MGDMFRDALAFNQDISTWDISQVTVFNGFLYWATSFSTASYDVLLISWAAQAVQSGISFESYAQYSAGAAATARQYLIDTYSWIITDGGEVP